MSEFKSIITHPEGQNLFPGQITTIEGYPHGTAVAMKNTKPQIGLTPYGASYMQPDMYYKFAGDTVVELPQAQMGGGDPQQDQLMQIIQMYAQMKQMDPNELIQKIQSLPENQQQQAIESIAQEVQQAMAQQQQAQAPEGDMSTQQMMGENMPEGEMMSHGGEPCFGCFDKYNPSPQAQDLNWYYKATGGEAFPQANMYPEDWASYSGNQYAQGGEAFPQAQTYLPNDRPHETRPNFMFKMGGQSDIDRAYQIMKKGGMDYNPRKKKGGKFNHLEEFQKYLNNEKKGKKFQDGGEQDENYNQMMTSNAYSNMKDKAFFDTLKNTTLDNYWDQPTPDKEKVKLTGPAYDSDDEDMDWVANPFAEAESQLNDMEREFGDGEISDNNSNAAEKYAKRKAKTTPHFNTRNQSTDYLNGMAAMTGNKGLIGALAAVNNLGNAVGDAAAGWSQPGRAFRSSASTQMQGGGAIAESPDSENEQRDYSKYPDIYNTKGKFLGRYENTSGGCPSWVPAEECAKYQEESKAETNTSIPPLQVNRYFQVRQEGNSDKPWENKYWIAQQGEGTVNNQQQKQWKAPNRFANPNHLNEWRSIGYNEYQKLKQQEDEQGRINYQELKKRGGLARAQDGGPYVYVSPNVDNSYFNPLSGDIYLNEDQSHIPAVFPHEYQHYLQWKNGQFKVPPGAYEGEENLPASLNPYLPLMMPSIVRNLDFEGQIPYYNRRPIEQMAITNDFLGQNPSFDLVNPGLIYDKVSNPEMYENPYMLEGEAQVVGDRYIGPTMQRGGLPKHDVVGQTGSITLGQNLSQPSGTYNTWNIQTPANIQNSSTYQGIQQANQDAVRIADQNVVKQGTDKTGGIDSQYLKKSNKTPGPIFDFQRAERDVAGLGQVADYLHNFKERNNPNKDKERRNLHTSEFMDVAQFGGGQYGDWSTNATQGTSFRPDEMVYAQKAGRPYKDVNVYNYSDNNFSDAWGSLTVPAMQTGGSVLDQYNEDEEYDLTPEEIRQILAAGGTIEYL